MRLWAAEGVKIAPIGGRRLLNLKSNGTSWREAPKRYNSNEVPMMNTEKEEVFIDLRFELTSRQCTPYEMVGDAVGVHCQRSFKDRLTVLPSAKEGPGGLDAPNGTCHGTLMRTMGSSQSAHR
jgi:hypothetical protein